MSAFHGSINRGNLPQQIAGPRMDNQNQSSIADVARGHASPTPGLPDCARRFATSTQLPPNWRRCSLAVSLILTAIWSGVSERQLQRSNTELNYSLSARQE